RDAQGDGGRQEQGQHRGVQGAPDEREGAELAGDRVPCRGPPEVEAELLDRHHRLTRKLHANRHDNDDEDERKGARPQAETPILRSHYESLTCVSAASSSLTTASGSGA